HMPGMEGAEATVSGVFATTAYEVSFNPTNGGEREENHRWVIHEDISESTKGAFEPGEEVTLEADHMEGMEGATAIIDDAVTTNVYMVDYQPTDGGAVVRNHKWFVEEELAQ
ncbi:YdhK family protein, partial [Aerococcus urinaeequi]